MILWILAFVLMGILGLIGYYQGAIRVGFSFIGLLVAAALAIPLSPIIKPLLRIFGFEHPVILSFIAPFIVYVLILVGFKSGAFAVHKKVDTIYKYRASDTERMLFERMNARIGVALGIANAFVYFILICVVGYVLGYFTVQVSTAENSSFSVKMANMVADGLQSTKMNKAIASFVPGAETYYDSIDIMGDLYRNPLLQARLGSYPPFLSLAERPEFQTLAKDSTFQEKLWLKNPRPSLGEFLQHEKVKPLVHNVELFTNVMGMMNYDLKDLKGYIQTGKSPKYDDEKILGHWYYDFANSFKRARRAKLNMGPLEIKAVRESLGAFTNSILTAYVDNRLVLRAPGSGNSTRTLLTGTWKGAGSERYDVALRENNKELDVPTTLEASKLVLKKDRFALVFER